MWPFSVRSTSPEQTATQVWYPDVASLGGHSLVFGSPTFKRLYERVVPAGAEAEARVFKADRNIVGPYGYVSEAHPGVVIAGETEGQFVVGVPIKRSLMGAAEHLVRDVVLTQEEMATAEVDLGTYAVGKAIHTELHSDNN